VEATHETQVAEIKATVITDKSAVRAGVSDPSKSEAALLMYAEGLAGSTDPKESRPMVYTVKSAAGWKK